MRGQVQIFDPIVRHKTPVRPAHLMRGAAISCFVFTSLPGLAHTQVTLPPAAAATPPQAVAPIITDDDFTKALPPLDTTKTSTAKPTGVHWPTVPERPAAQAESLPGVTASQDMELNAPLPALDSFDIQPLASSGRANIDETPPPVAYTTTVDGLRETGLLDAFKSLSALQAGKGKAVNTAMVRARATDDEALILRLLKSRGYIDGAVTTQLKASSSDTSRIVAHLIVTPGSLYRLSTIAIDASPTTPPGLLRQGLPLKADEPIIADQVLAAEANLSVVMQQSGYPFGKVGDRDVALDPAKLTGDYTLKVDIGHRSRFGGFKSDGREAFSADHVGVLTRFSPGDLYDNRKVNDLREALVGTSLFRSVSVEPVSTGQINPDGTETVDLLVHQQKGPQKTLAAELGYSTGEGFTATGSWQDRNMYPPEGALIVTGALGTQQQGLTTTFRRANDKRRDRTLSLSLAANHNIYDSYEAFSFGFSGSVARVSTPLWQKIWTWSYGLDANVSRESDSAIITPTTKWKTYYITDLPIKIGYDRSDDLLNPKTGYRLSVQLVPEASLSGGSGSNLRTVLDASGYYPIGDNIIIATRARLGSLLGGNFTDVAPSRRLYGGGGGSVRGYAYQALGPHDASNTPTGGSSLVEASAELRYRFGDYGIVPFVDMGQVYESTTPSFKDIHVGVGIGARLYTNFGPLRIDIATPLNRKNKEAPIALYVGIGQAF